MATVSIQGQKGSFHDFAARKFFGATTDLKHCNTFRDVFDSLNDNTADYGVVALENSLFGSINPVYDLLLNTDCTIIGEVYVRVEFCLLGIPGTTIDKIKEVYSQLPALVECDEYLNSTLKHAKQIEENDTAGSAKLVQAWNDQTKAAIASEQAGKIYGLDVIARNIETHHENFTRFAILQRKSNHSVISNNNKTSIVLQTPKDTKSGSLFHALSIFAKHKINMTTLNSRPIIGKAWHYMFYIDIEIGSSSPQYTAVLSDLREQGCSIEILGNYKSGLDSI